MNVTGQVELKQSGQPHNLRFLVASQAKPVKLTVNKGNGLAHAGQTTRLKYSSGETTGRYRSKQGVEGGLCASKIC